MMNSLQFIKPELVLTAAGLMLLVCGVFGLRRKPLGLIALMAIVIGFFSLPMTLDSSSMVFSGMLTNDVFSFVMRALVLVATGLAVLMSIGYSWSDHDDAGEYYFFLLVAAISMMLTVSATNLLMIYLAIETLSIVSYVLACSFKKDLYSTEAGLKYFLFGALSTGIMLYGISLVYGLLGTLSLPAIGLKLAAGGIHEPTLVLAGLLVFAGFAFKASLVPFHMWVADVYEGAPWPVAAFFSIGPKAIGFALLARVFFGFPAFLTSGWEGIAVFLAIATMTIGNFSAFHQESVKRLLAFSSVAQAGYILAGLAAGVLGLKAAFFYIVIYTFMNMGAFACASFLSSERAPLESFKGMGRRAPGWALVFSIFLLSLAGLPPLAGFLAKFFVLVAVIDVKQYFLATAVVVNSVVAFFYYLKVIKVMYFEDSPDSQPIRIPVSGMIVLAICLSAVLLFGFWPQLIMNILALIFA
ncbi:MAG: NADH-quinone oxidoreductase subunit N [Candidatus Omnitrophica bacterium]|nr:NADH-quinone oxidoreductase subunit N [Candidatus Omnitrophota bacterium]